jgi:predicted phosphohydrolase
MSRRIFAISDLHLSHAQPKPMEMFGEHWKDHAARIERSWKERVSARDIVLVGGDISWAMKLADALPDLWWIEALPGEKVLVKGNHDYWWDGIGRVRKAAGKGMHFIQNDAVMLDGIAIGGSRLWNFPDVYAPESGFGRFETRLPGSDSRADEEGAPETGFKVPSPEEMKKICARELKRLRMSLSRLPDGAVLRIALVHFPPVNPDVESTEITKLMDEFRIDICVYGHLHPRTLEPVRGADRVLGRTRYVLTSCDTLGFQPKCLWEPGAPAGASQGGITSVTGSPGSHNSAQAKK